MSAPVLIGLGGRLASGKDTVADRLVSPHSFVKLGMSDPLNEAMMTLNPIIGVAFPYGFDAGGETRRYSDLVEQLGYTEAKKLPEVRRLLQVFGTEVGRKLLGENIWVDIAKRRIQTLQAEGVSVALTGIRFPNELQAISDLGGVSVWVDRWDELSPAEHASENSVAPSQFDVRIANDGTLDELYAKVDDFITSAQWAA